MLTLVIREPQKQVRDFELKDGPYLLGRDNENDIVLSDEGVSRKHARILFENGSFIIEDLESTAGVYVNRKKIQEKCSLSSGDEILVGTTEIKIEGEWPEDDKTGQIDLDEDDKTKMVSPDDLQKYLEGRDHTPKKSDDTQIILEQDQVLPQSEEEKTRMLGAEEVFIPESDQTPRQDKTVYINPEEEQQTVINYHKLLVISKNTFGKEYILDQAEISIGRSRDCYVVIDNDTASGTHATIRIDGNDCTITDMNSKNGTIVNGSLIHKECSLRKGDEIEIGDTRFKFIHRDTAISKEELLSEIKQSEKKKLSNKVLIGILAVLSIIIILAAIFRDTEVPEQRPPAQVVQTDTDIMEPLVSEELAPDIEEKPDVQEELAKSTADIYFSAANEFLKNRLWDEAIAKFEEVHSLDPDYPGVPDGLFVAKTEALNLSLLEEGLLLISRRRYNEGIRKLEGIPQESVYIDEATLEIQFAREEIKPPKAKEKAEVSKKTPEAPKTVPLNQKGGELVDQALKYYAQGNTKIAITKLNAALELNFPQEDPLKTKATSLKEKIEKVQQAYDKGLAEYNNKNFGQAFQIWADVINMDQEIVGQEKSHFSNRIAIYMADEFYRQAREAYENRQYVVSYSNCRNALTASPGHEGCLEIEGLLAEKARKVYEEGYILEDLNPTQAVQKWKMVLGMCSPENTYFKKAKSRIEKYELK